MSVSKIVAAAASGVGGAGLDVESVFSTYLYEGTEPTDQTITNGIDLAGEGGMVWIKTRSVSGSNMVFDTERGTGKTIFTHTTSANQTYNPSSQDLMSFNSDGFTVGDEWTGPTNRAGVSIASWTFRKAPKFFDVVTFTGTGSHPRNVSHNLGSVPGMILVKNLGDSTEDWIVYHRGVDSSAPEDYGIFLNLTDSRVNNDAYWGDTAPTSTTFTVGGNITNQSGENFIAYLFAHNDGDGDFGPDGDADIIKCGSFTGVGSGAVDVDLGFEPQFVFTKNTSRSADWMIQDVMRGMSHSSWNPIVANKSETELSTTENRVVPSATGFTINNNGGNDMGQSGDTVIYIAIRRGTKVPESATEVFAIDNQTASSAPFLTSNFPVDMVIRKRTTGGNSEVMSRLTQGKALFANATSSEQTDSVAQFDFNDGCLDNTSTDAARYGWMWKRAPGYFDAVAYTGNGVQGRNITHNLGVAPDMIWVKNRDDSVDWAAYVSGITHLSVFGSDPDSYGDNPVRLELNTTEQAQFSGSGNWDHTHPTDTVFRVGDTNATNGTGDSLIAYLFASLDGISKVGSFTQGASSQTIDCGFSSGARFVLIKRTDGVNNWIVFDSERGIVSGNDPFLKLDNTNGEEVNDDIIDPHSSGFIVNTVTDWTESGQSFIFYAIA